MLLSEMLIASIRLLALLLAACFALCAAHVHAADLQEVQRLVQEGQATEAIARLDELMQARPREAQWRFMKAVLLADTPQRDQAIDLYRQLTLDFPELPEPYNNLAALYAQRGQYDRARDALEAAVRANPAYAIAQQNLGDVYLQLSRQAYQRAQELDPRNVQIPPRLTALHQLLAADPPSR